MAKKYSIGVKHESSDFPKISETFYFFQPEPYQVSEPLEVVFELPLVLSETKPLFDYLGYTQHDVADVMEVDPSTLSRWKKEDKTLTRLLSKNIKDMDKIIAKGIRIFGSEDQFREWLHTTNHALGNQKPAILMRNPYDLERVGDALEAMSWGSLA